MEKNEEQLNIFQKARKLAKKIKQNILALYLILRRKDVSWVKKAYIGLVVSYALSPIDLIPDFIPVLGYLDDVIILPFAIVLAIKMIPKTIFEACQLEAEKMFSSSRPKSWMAGIMIILIWISIIGYLIFQYYEVILSFFNK